MRSILGLLTCVALSQCAELHQAARACDPDHMRQILSRHPPLNEIDANGMTPLHVAIETRQTICVRLLFEAGADPNVKDVQGRTPPEAAFRHIPDLQDAKAVEEWRTMVAMFWKANQEKSRASTAPAPWTLEYSAAHGQTESTKMLLKLGADPNAAGTTGTTPLAEAALKGDVEGVRVLLKYDARVDAISAAGTQPIHDAALGNNAEVIRELVQHGAKIDARSRDDARTPLHFAAAMGKLKAAEALVSLGADLSIKDSQGRTPLDVAERAGLTEVVEFLRNAAAAKK